MDRSTKNKPKIKYFNPWWVTILYVIFIIFLFIILINICRIGYKDGENKAVLTFNKTYNLSFIEGNKNSYLD